MLKTTEQPLPALTSDVLEQIFSWIPMERVFVFRRVCQQLNNVLRKRYFAKLLLNRAVDPVVLMSQLKSTEELMNQFVNWPESVQYEFCSQFLNKTGSELHWGFELRQPLLTGIPKAISALTNLKRIHIVNCQNLKGFLPKEIMMLRQLESLVIVNTGISGSIPPEIGNLEKLDELNLGFNALSGMIPPEIGRLMRLKSIILQSNQLSGTLPLEFCELKKLKILFVDGNMLEGLESFDRSKMPLLKHTDWSLNRIIE
ncbi:UNVERIFIED_CONTAM: hypothetical protein HDU68_010259 [Siphonaria sp. JEL0065]|nr:hypothetical protein HDU68_010259 [Siphonaria sp. JEL0065]